MHKIQIKNAVKFITRIFIYSQIDLKTFKVFHKISMRVMWIN